LTGLNATVFKVAPLCVSVIITDLDYLVKSAQSSTKVRSDSLRNVIQ
jgi:hypothetical protein